MININFVLLIYLNIIINSIHIGIVFASDENTKILNLPSFKMDQLDVLQLDEVKETILKKFSNYEELLKNDKSQESIYKVFFKHKTYYFATLLHFYKNKLADYLVTFPTYFLHDPIFKQIRDLLGAQDKMHRELEHAIYYWNNPTNNPNTLVIYEAICTITCFPHIYFKQNTKIVDKNYRSIFKMMEENPLY